MLNYPEALQTSDKFMLRGIGRCKEWIFWKNDQRFRDLVGYRMICGTTVLW